MYTFETLELENKEGFNLTLSACEEHIPIDETLLDESMLEETIKAVENYDLMYFCAKVTASKNGIELGSNYLGCCFEKELEDFKKSGYLEQMIEEAITEAKETLKELVA